MRNTEDKTNNKVNFSIGDKKFNSWEEIYYYIIDLEQQIRILENILCNTEADKNE